MAEISVHKQMTLKDAIITTHGSATESMAGDRQKAETDSKGDGVPSIFCRKVQSQEVVRLDRGVNWTVDPEKKRYVETPVPTPEQLRAAAENVRAELAKLESCGGSARVAPTMDPSKCNLSEPQMAVDKTDEVATFAGHDARRTNLKISPHCVNAQPGQDCELAVLAEVWLTTDEIPGLAARAAFKRRYATKPGLADATGAISEQLGQYMAPYASDMKKLLDKAGGLKGYPLKTAFRVEFTGTPCGTPTTASAGSPTHETGGAVADAGAAAGEAARSSVGTAAAWTAADAARHVARNGTGAHRAGTSAGAFTSKLTGGLLSKRKRPEEAKTKTGTATDGRPAPAAPAEFTIETTAISNEPVAADRFEPTPDWTRILAEINTDSTLESCR